MKFDKKRAYHQHSVRSLVLAAPELRTWLPWSELAHTPRLTLDEFRKTLREYPRSALFVACARLAIIFDYGPEATTAANEKTTTKCIPMLFPLQFVRMVQDYAAEGRVIFFQGQLRFLVSELMRLEQPYPDESRNVPDTTLGPLLLAAGELLYKAHTPDLPTELDLLANLVADFLPTYEITSITEPTILFLRFYIFVTVIIPTLPIELKTFEIDGMFEEHFGFPLKRYCQFIFAFMTHATIERQNAIAHVLDGALRVSWFQKTVLSEKQVQQMFDTVCFSLADLPKKKQPIGYGDFELLKDQPYFKLNDAVYCLDYEYAMSKIESAALWRLLRTLNEKQKITYLGFWGNVFEAYVGWLFTTYISPSLSRFYPSLKYAHDQNRSICDGVVVCGSTAILIEMKLATCPVTTRYSGDYEKFRLYMEDRLVTGTDRPVGVSQLITAVNTLTQVKGALPSELAGVKKFISLIITKDEIGSSWVINAYLNARFQAKLVRKKCRPFIVTPLVTMNVSTLERAISSLKTISLSDILEERIRADTKLTAPFEAKSSYVPPGPPRDLTKHNEIVDIFAAELATDFGLTE